MNAFVGSSTSLDTRSYVPFEEALLLVYTLRVLACTF